MAEEIVPFDSITVPEGTLIHIAGIPFRLAKATAVLGSQANYWEAVALLIHSSKVKSGVSGGDFSTGQCDKAK